MIFCVRKYWDWKISFFKNKDFNFRIKNLISKISVEKVIGAGTTVDSARFRQLVARETQEPVESVTGMVLGEHGENAVPIWSSVTIMGGKSSDNLKGLVHDTYAKVFARDTQCFNFWML